MPHRREGFTLIEVLVAAFVASLVFGFLVSWMAQNLRKVGAERAKQHALLLAEQRARDFDLELRQSGLVESGTEHGEFPPPDSDLGWEIDVEPWHLPLPADYKLAVSPSPIFEPVGRQRPSGDPPLHLVTVRVFRLDQPKTDLIEPFVLFGVVPGESPKAGGAAGAGAGANPEAAYDTNGDGTLDAKERENMERDLARRNAAPKGSAKSPMGKP